MNVESNVIPASDVSSGMTGFSILEIFIIIILVIVIIIILFILWRSKKPIIPVYDYISSVETSADTIVIKTNTIYYNNTATSNPFTLTIQTICPIGTQLYILNGSQVPITITNSPGIPITSVPAQSFQFTTTT